MMNANVWKIDMDSPDLSEGIWFDVPSIRTTSQKRRGEMFSQSLEVSLMTASGSELCTAVAQPMGRSTSGVWRLLFLFPRSLDSTGWANLVLHATEHFRKDRYISKFVQFFPVELCSRQKALAEMGWKYEGFLTDYYWYAGRYHDACQYSQRGDFSDF